MKEKILEQFSLEELKDMVNEVNSWNGELDYLDYQVNDKEFFNIYFYNKSDEAVRATYYGDYNYMDDYVRFNAYGNLDSCSEYQYEQEIKDYSEEIVDTFYRNINNLWADELKRKVEKFMEGNNEE